jgi:hypothetical protein
MPPPLPQEVYAEIGRVEYRSRGNVTVELGDRGTVPGGVAVQFHTRSVRVQTTGVYVVRHHRLAVVTKTWTWWDGITVGTRLH